MDFIKEWAGSLLAAGALAASPMLWRIATAYMAKKAGQLAVKAVDRLLVLGDKEWDQIIYAVAAKVENEIKDDIKADNPKLVKVSHRLCAGEKCWGLLAGREKEIAQLLAAVLRQLDVRAKDYAKRKAEES